MISSSDADCRASSPAAFDASSMNWPRRCTAFAAASNAFVPAPMPMPAMNDALSLSAAEAAASLVMPTFSSVFNAPSATASMTIWNRSVNDATNSPR